MFKAKMKKLFFIILISLLILNNCAKRDPVTGKKILEETNPDVRAKTISDQKKRESGGIFGATREFQFSSSNPLWRASLEVIDFVPLNTVDYSGGVIVTDWYTSQNSKDSIKLTLNFVSNELAPSSIRVKSFIKKCDVSPCVVINGSEKLNTKIKSKIVLKAREIKKIQVESKR